MIGVIADDFTGAAEIAGIGLRHGLSVDLSLAVNKATAADLLIIATDTRSLSEEKAVAVMAKCTKLLMLLNPDFLFKKIDSALRGHIVAEIQVQMKITGHRRALIVAGNPALQRTIQNEIYYYHEKPIHLSSFSQDPDFAINSSRVQDMLRCQDIIYKKIGENLPDEGISVAEVNNTAAMQNWVGYVNSQTFVVGASSFLSALLDLRGFNKTTTVTLPFKMPQLFVCGTTFAKSRKAIQVIKENNGPVCYLPAKAITNENADNFDDWLNEISGFAKTTGKVIVAIDSNSIEGIDIQANDLRHNMAKLVKKVLQKITFRELLIEGGATATALFEEMDFTSFVPIQELATGVVRMKVQQYPSLYVTVKPGSYDWAEGIWNF